MYILIIHVINLSTFSHDAYSHLQILLKLALQSNMHHMGPPDILWCSNVCTYTLDFCDKEASLHCTCHI